MTSLFLAMGTIVDGHTLYLNGKAVGNAPRLTASNARANATTDENGVSCEASLTYNRFAFGTDPDLRTPTVQIAIRVTSSYGSSRAGGLYDTGAPDTRVGAYDAGASEGQRQTGYRYVLAYLLTYSLTSYPFLRSTSYYLLYLLSYFTYIFVALAAWGGTERTSASSLIWRAKTRKPRPQLRRVPFESS